MEYNETPDSLMNLQKIATGIMAFYILVKIDGKTRETCILSILSEIIHQQYVIPHLTRKVLVDD